MLNSDWTDEGVKNVAMDMDKSMEDEYDYKFELFEEQFVILYSQTKKVNV